MFENILKNESNKYLRKDTKEEIIKIRLINYRLVFKETIKVMKINKKDLVESKPYYHNTIFIKVVEQVSKKI